MDATATDLQDARRRASAIGAAPLFRSWPTPALLRLARAASVATYAPGTLVVEGGQTSAILTVAVDGTALVCVTGPEGMGVTFKIASGASVHGLIPLVDDKEMSNDLIALDTVKAVHIPHSALRAELRAAPTLWGSVAVDLAEQARRYAEQMKRFGFDQRLVHLCAPTDGNSAFGRKRRGGLAGADRAEIFQELVAAMLGMSRQWASARYCGGGVAVAAA